MLELWNFFFITFFHWVVDLTRVISERTSGRQTGVKRSKHLSGWCHKIDIRKSGGERDILRLGDMKWLSGWSHKSDIRESEGERYQSCKMKRLSGWSHKSDIREIGEERYIFKLGDSVVEWLRSHESYWRVRERTLGQKMMRLWLVVGVFTQPSVC